MPGSIASKAITRHSETPIPKVRRYTVEAPRDSLFETNVSKAGTYKSRFSRVRAIAAHKFPGVRAFSSEVDTGSREENASKLKPLALTISITSGNKRKIRVKRQM